MPGNFKGKVNWARMNCLQILFFGYLKRIYSLHKWRICIIAKIEGKLSISWLKHFKHCRSFLSLPEAKKIISSYCLFNLVGGVRRNEDLNLLHQHACCEGCKSSNPPARRQKQMESRPIESQRKDDEKTKLSMKTECDCSPGLQ
jgi:hypothetical protein